jgi:hypothetical protein
MLPFQAPGFWKLERLAKVELKLSLQKTYDIVPSALHTGALECHLQWMKLLARGLVCPASAVPPGQRSCGCKCWTWERRWACYVRQTSLYARQQHIWITSFSQGPLCSYTVQASWFQLLW